MREEKAPATEPEPPEPSLGPEPKEYYARMRWKALKDERAGKTTIMRNPHVQPKPPRAPGMQSARFNGYWWHY